METKTKDCPEKEKDECLGDRVRGEHVDLTVTWENSLHYAHTLLGRNQRWKTRAFVILLFNYFSFSLIKSGINVKISSTRNKSCSSSLQRLPTLKDGIPVRFALRLMTIDQRLQGSTRPLNDLCVKEKQKTIDEEEEVEGDGLTSSIVSRARS